MHSLKLFHLNMKYNINGTTGSGNVLKKYIYLFASVCMLNPFMHYKWPFYLLAFKKLIRFMNHFGALVLFLTFSFCQKKEGEMVCVDLVLQGMIMSLFQGGMLRGLWVPLCSHCLSA